MKRAAEKAVALDPASSEARTALACSKLLDWDWSGAEKEFRKAIALNPNDASAHDGFGYYLCKVGRLEECWKEWETAQELDPKQDHLSQEFLWRGDYDRAIELAKKSLESRPKDAVMHWFLAGGYALKGMHKDWVRETGEWITLVGFPDSANRIRQAFEGSGYRGALRQEARELERWVANKQAYVPGNLAVIYASLGNKDRAFYWLGHGIDHHDMAMHDSLDTFKVDPAFAPLWPDPRFKDMLRRAGLPQ
jgi:tetratricopeptide (TPR) repeat protein